MLGVITFNNYIIMCAEMGFALAREKNQPPDYAIISFIMQKVTM